MRLAACGLMLLLGAAATGWHSEQQRRFRASVATFRPWVDIEGRLVRVPGLTVAELERILQRGPEKAALAEEGESVQSYRWWSPLGGFRMYAVVEDDGASGRRVSQLRIPAGVR
jgi:hypothetical protein